MVPLIQAMNYTILIWPIAVFLSLAPSYGAAQKESSDKPAVAQPTQPVQPKPAPVTCKWNGVAAIPDPNCPGTRQRRVLSCSDGSEGMGSCLK